MDVLEFLIEYTGIVVGIVVIVRMINKIRPTKGYKKSVTRRQTKTRN